MLKGSSTPTAVHCNKPDTATNLWVPTATADFQGANGDTKQNKQSSISKPGAAAAVLLLSAAAGLFYGLETRGMVAPNLLAASSVSAKLLDIASILWYVMECFQECYIAYGIHKVGSRIEKE